MLDSHAAFKSRTTKAPATTKPSTPSVNATPNAVDKAENPWALLLREEVELMTRSRRIEGAWCGAFLPLPPSIGR